MTLKKNCLYSWTALWALIATLLAFSTGDFHILQEMMDLRLILWP